MKIQDLFEGRQTPCIVVDVQPAYDHAINNAEGMFQFLNEQRSPILMFCNAEQEGLTEDTVDDVKFYWEEHGFNRDWNDVEIVDKGFGHFRAWMDFDAVPPAGIIKTIREMYRQGVTDSRELFSGDDSIDYEDEMEEFLGTDFNSIVLGDPLGVEWTSVAQLKRFSGSYIMGGGREECLREVELLMNTFNIKYKRIEEFIY